ncbi:hypothetical protein ABIB56_001305 [Glaciihabitans sp. UYNi722]
MFPTASQLDSGQSRSAETAARWSAVAAAGSRTVEDLELATLGGVHWHNTQRLHGYPGDIPPAEFETAFYAEQTDHPQAVEIR